MSKRIFRDLRTTMLGLCALGFPFQSLAKPTETILYSFTGGNDGAAPLAGLTKVGDLLYGTTSGGGAGGRGTVFSITGEGLLTVLYAFEGSSDADEVRAPLLYAGGDLYGTSVSGGAYGPGTVFKVSLSGEEAVIFSFTGRSDGSQPWSPLVELNGILYGTTVFGGSSDIGTIFSVTKSGKETVLHSFAEAGGEQPYAGLTILNGVLYGTASDGGSYSPGPAGTAFSITPDGKFTLLHSFGGPNDGNDVWGTLFPVNGTLYGTTMAGGPGGSEGGKGVLFSLTTTGEEQVIGYFSGNSGYGAVGNLLAKGKFLYGIAQAGGGAGSGSVFKAALAGGHKAHAEYGFGKKNGDGGLPSPGLLRVGNNFYGVTVAGGKYKQGAIFKITQ